MIIKVKTAIKSSKRVGRGPSSGTGKTCGRGQKGQHARSNVRRGFEGGQMPLYRRVARRGFSRARFLPVEAIVHLYDLERAYTSGENVTIANLKERNIIPQRAQCVKVLSAGSSGLDKVLTKALNIVDLRCSKTAEKKIIKASGSIGGKNG